MPTSGPHDAIEADSLSSLNFLANNPPKYAEGTSPYRSEDLDLYISPVPDSQDVIISTSKPLMEGKVTEQDILNALYFVHLELPSDDQNSLDSARHENRNRSSEDSGPLAKAIPRKPLPSSARPRTPNSLPNDNCLSQHLAGTDVSTTRKSVDPLENGHTANASEPTVDMPERTVARLHTGMPKRKPLGPRPMGASVSPTDTEAVGSPGYSIMRGSIDGAPENQVKPIAIPRPEQSVRSNGDANLHARSYPSQQPPVQQMYSRSPSPPKRSIASGKPFTLTLIRKDPSTSNRWVIGRISSQQLDLPPADQESPPKSISALWSATNAAHVRHPPIDICIQSSGYVKFRDTCRNSSRQNQDVSVFTRQVAMGYSKSFITNVKELSLDALHAGRDFLQRQRHRSNSAASNTSAKSEAAVTPDTIVTSGPPPQGMTARGYTFDSPWEGKCTFSSGRDGRRLHCRYKPDVPINGRNTNSLVDSALTQSAEKEVSELTFNLQLFSPQSRGSHLLRAGGSSHDDDLDNEPLHIRNGIGQPGGGHNGKQAKLGKLTIKNEGFKMLDLLVAANIGIWWGAREKLNLVPH